MKNLNRAFASLAQVIGQITVLIAVVYLFWSVADLVGDNSNNIAPIALNSPNRYIAVIATSASIAVSGMFAIALGMMLERTAGDEPIAGEADDAN